MMVFWIISATVQRIAQAPDVLHPFVVRHKAPQVRDNRTLAYTHSTYDVEAVNQIFSYFGCQMPKLLVMDTCLFVISKGNEFA